MRARHFCSNQMFNHRTFQDGFLFPAPAQEAAVELREESLVSADLEEEPGLVLMPASTQASTWTLALVSAPVLVASVEAMLEDSLSDRLEVMLSDLQAATEESLAA